MGESMNKKDSIWESIGNYYFWTKIAPDILAPIIIILLIIIVALVQFSNSTVNSVKYKKDKNAILATKLEDVSYKYAKEVYNKDEFSKVELKHNIDYETEIEYTFKNNNKTSSEYDRLAKEELSKLYNKLKDKKIIDDYVFTDIGTRDIKLKFNYPTDYAFNYLGSTEIEYNEKEGFNETKYNEEMNKEIITENNLQDVINRKG